MSDDRRMGSGGAFDANWRGRRETKYNHWAPRQPKNQIQLAFRNHWTLFRELLPERMTGRVLEVGCGRGSISSYFADNRYETILLDISPAVVEAARDVFESNGHRDRASFLVGDALKLPIEDNAVDVTVSIGVLEHFEDVRQVMAEQVRVLQPGGRFLGYVVPERPDNVQRHWRWVNRVLSGVAGIFSSAGGNAAPPKEDLYRSDYGSDHYRTALEGLPIENFDAFGMYPLPMISHSPEFPFSLLPGPLEAFLTGIFRSVLGARRALYGRHPWKCDEALGQAFLVTFTKARADGASS